MMLVFRPRRYVADWKGFRIHIESESATEDMMKFEAAVEEFKKLWDSLKLSR